MGSDPRVVIAGAGWAGLAAAVELADHGVPVTLLESAREPGGRARGAEINGARLDNGQHLLIGAYREILRLQRLMGLREQDLFTRTPLCLHLQGRDGPLDVRAPRWPAPLNLLWAIGRARGLSPRERAAALRFALRMGVAGFTIPEDQPVATLLARHRQPARVIEGLWAPLCIATLNIAPEEASAGVFLRVLRDAFARRARDSDLLFPRVDLGRLFPQPAVDFVRRCGGEVRFSARVKRIANTGEAVTAVETEAGGLPATHLVLAVPPWEAANLLSPLAGCGPLAGRLRGFAHTPVATVWLEYECSPMQQPMIGLVGTLTHWVIDRTDLKPGMVAAVISGPGEHMDSERAILARQVAEELSGRLGWPAPRESFAVREKRAAFRCTPGIDAQRPGAATPLRNLWLAGDYTATGYPATLEGAVRSGVECARLILHDLGTRGAAP